MRQNYNALTAIFAALTDEQANAADGFALVVGELGAIINNYVQ